MIVREKIVPIRVLALLALVLSVLLSAACSTVRQAPPAGPVVEVDGVIIRNQLGRPVTDVTVLAVAAGGFVTCGSVLARSTCSTGFQNRYYASDKLQVTWKESGIPQSTDEFTIEPNDEIDLDRPAQVEVIIYAPGQAGVRLVQ
jgi:uncharacterized protein YceK